MIRIALLFSLLIFVCVSVSCGTAENEIDYNAFLAMLKERGFSYTEEEEIYTASGFFAVEPRRLIIGSTGEVLYIHEYDSAESMESDSQRVGSDGFSIGNSQISWVSQPHFFKKDKILVYYIGENEQILDFLRAGLGAAFAGESFIYETTWTGLMEGAAPQTSALALYYYDDAEISLSYIYSADTTQKILDELNAVEAIRVGELPLSDITLPVYGFSIGKEDGFSIFAAWSNGYWVSQDGIAYRFDFDFERLAVDYPWKDKRPASFAYFPCAYFLTKGQSRWESALLTSAAELEPPEGVTMSLKSWDEFNVAVSFENNGAAEWMYGEYYTLQVLLNGVWYDVPLYPGNWGFISIGYNLLPGEAQDRTYNILMHGALPPGTYRLVVEGLSVENTIP